MPAYVDSDDPARQRQILTYFATFSGEDAPDNEIVITDAPSMERFRLLIRDQWRADHGLPPLEREKPHDR